MSCCQVSHSCHPGDGDDGGGDGDDDGGDGHDGDDDDDDGGDGYDDGDIDGHDDNSTTMLSHFLWSSFSPYENDLNDKY